MPVAYLISFGQSRCYLLSNVMIKPTIHVTEPASDFFYRRIVFFHNSYDIEYIIIII